MKNSRSTSVGRFVRVAFGVALVVLAPLAWADVDQALLEKADALLKEGKADEAYQLLEPIEVQGAGDLVYDYLLGTAALESNRPSKATFVYERILAVAPAYVGVRADMGRAYFALGDYGRAKIEFESVLAFQNLPNDLRGSVEQYAKAAEARAQAKTTVATGYLEIGFGNDSNINSANGSALINYPGSALVPAGAYSPDKKSDNYATLGLGGEVNHQLSDKWGLYVGGDYRGRAYQTYCDNTCNFTLDTRGGVTYTGAGWLLKTGLTAGGYNLNNALYRDSAGLTADWRMALSSGNQVSLGLISTRTSYLNNATVNQNTQTNSVSAGWLTSLGDGTAIFSLTASGGVELSTGGRDDGDKQFFGLSALIQKSFNDRWGGYVVLNATPAKYSGTNTLYGISRDESLYELSFGVTWTVTKGVSVRPQVTYTKNASNAELYSYDKTDASVNLRLDF